MPEITTITNTRRIYRDVSLTFARNPVTHDVVTVTDADAVKRSIRFLLLSRAGETPFYPNFGSRLYGFLFEPFDQITTVLIKSEITATLEAFEPRMNIQELTVSPDEEKNAYQINLVFNLVNQVQPLTFTLYLSRLR
jgi:phage baseplate assembly protein W